MHNKSFFQGLGLGIVIASVIFLVLYSTRAKEDVKEIVSEEIEQTETESVTSVLELPNKKEPETEASMEIGTIGEIQTIKTEEFTISQKELNLDKNLKEDKVKIKIEDGENASDIYKRLYELGIIEDENGFSDFIRKNNLSTRKISSGEFEITKGASYREIYEIIKSK